MNKITGIALSISVALFLSACGSSGSTALEEGVAAVDSSDVATTSGSATASSVDLNKQIVGKTYYLGDPYVEIYAFSADGTIKDTWLVDGEEVSETGIYSVDGDVLNITFASTEGTARLSNAKIVDDSLRFYSDANVEVARFYTQREGSVQSEVEGVATGSFIALTQKLLDKKVVYLTFEDSEKDSKKYAEMKFFERGDTNGIAVTKVYDANGTQTNSSTIDTYTILGDGTLEIDTYDNFKLLVEEESRWVLNNTHITPTFREGNVTTERVIEWLFDKPLAIYNQENNISNDTNASE